MSAPTSETPDLEARLAEAVTRAITRGRSSAAGRRRIGFNGRWFALALILAVVATYFAFTQWPRADAYRSVGFRNPDWWLRPIEFNAFQRLPQTNANLSDVSALPDGKHAWAVGSGGMILHTSDGGRTWSRQKVTARPDRVPATLPVQTEPEAIETGAGESGADSPRQQPPTSEEPRDESERFPEKAVKKSSELGSARPLGRGIDGSLLLAASQAPRQDDPCADNQEPIADAGPDRTVEVGIVVRFDARRSSDPDGEIGRSAWVFGDDDGKPTMVYGGAGVIEHTYDTPGTYTVTLEVEDNCGAVSQGTAIITVVGPGEATRQGTPADGRGEAVPLDGEGGLAGNGSDAVEFTTQLNAVHFTDEDHGWAVGKRGTILRFEDGRWREHKDSGVTDVFLTDLWVKRDGSEGWIVGRDGTILFYRPGSGSWVPYEGETHWGDYQLAALWIAENGEQGWAVALTGELLRFESGRWYDFLYRNAEDGWLVGSDVSMSADGSRGWAVGTSQLIGDHNGVFTGTTARYENNTWREGPSPPELSAQPVTGVWTSEDGSEVWVVGWHGVIHHHDGEVWAIHPQSGELATAGLTAVTLTPDGRKGWIVGEDGTILGTEDRGETWYHQTRSPEAIEGGAAALASAGAYRRWPAPWYYLSLVVVLYCLRQTLRPPAEPKKKKGRKEEDLVAEEGLAALGNKVATDRPLEAGDPDPLGLGVLARGIARFLRNRKTEPPVTVAVTGPWGSGKSSLMNLVQADLKKAGFRPVWFNAWHHQKDERLLPALLEAIKAQAPPRPLRRGALRFRVRLYAKRVWDHWLVAALTLICVGVIARDLLGDDPSTIVAFFERLRDLDWQQDKAAEDLVAFLVTAFPSLAGVVGLWKGLRAFGVNPGELMVTQAKGAGVRALGTQASSRRRFQKEFGDVTAALGRSRIVILIDDLDRCRPRNVLDMLEAVNYLVTAGKCFVILGMERLQVIASVSIEFRELGRERAKLDGFPSDKEAESGETADGAERSDAVPNNDDKQTNDGSNSLPPEIDFASRYIKKLINIEVPVPRYSPEKLGQIGKDEDTPASRLVHQQQRVRTFAKRAVIALAIVALVGIGYIGIQWRDPIVQTIGNGIDGEKAETGVGVEGGQSSEQPGREDPGASEPLGGPTLFAPTNESEVVEFREGERHEQLGGIIVLPVVAIVLGVLLSLAVLLSQPELVEDPPEFENALKIWQPVVAAKLGTPREVKRFLNRIRYFAMLQEEPELPPPWWWQLWLEVGSLWGKAPAKEEAPAGVVIPPNHLVALGALLHLHEPCIRETEGCSGEDAYAKIAKYITVAWPLRFPPEDGIENFEQHKSIAGRLDDLLDSQKGKGLLDVFRARIEEVRVD